MPRILAVLIALTGAVAVATTLALAGDTPDTGVAARNATLLAAAGGAEKTGPRRATITVRRSRYGRVIFDGDGRALYLFTRERSWRPLCYGACATAWPPFLTEGAPRAGRGARAGLIGTTRRRDGATQVTYRGRPLYYYVGDRQPGQILCQNVVEFGGTWLVVRPDGRAVR